MSSDHYTLALQEYFRPFPLITTSHDGIQRKIHKYLLNVTRSNETTIDAAVLKIQELLNKNKELIPAYDRNLPLKTQLLEKPILIINGNAVCLTDEDVVPRGGEECSDDFFTQGLLNDPVRCQKKHLLERVLAENYASHTNGLCPVDKDPMGDLKPDSRLKEKCNQLRRQREEEKKKSCIIDEGIRHDEMQKRLARFEITRLKKYVLELSKRKLDRVEMSGDIVKVVAKISRGAFWQGGMYFGGKKAAVNAVKMYAKYIPFVSIAMGTGLGIYRFCNGNVTKGIAEIGSGLAASIPGPGTYVSAAVDLGIYASDVHDSAKIVVVNKDIKMYYDFLGIKTPTPQKRDVDNEIQRLSLIAINNNNEIWEVAKEAKQAIYAHHKWPEV